MLRLSRLALTLMVGAVMILSAAVGGQPAHAAPAVDSSSAAAVRAAYKEFKKLGSVPVGWNGSVGTCKPGAPSSAYQSGIERRVNIVRGLAGLESIKLAADLNRQAQAAALYMEANGMLMNPQPGMGCYSVLAVEGARNSNLFMGNTDPIAYYMDDPAFADAENRFYVLRPETKLMGSGAAKAGSSSSTHALVVWDETYPSTSPQLTAWPSAGYFPSELVPSTRRWSLQATGGVDLASASVTVSGPSGRIATTIAARQADTLVWTMPAVPEVKGSGAKKYSVTVSGIKGAGSSSHSYDVSIIDGDLGDPVPKPVPVLDYPEKLYRESGRHDYNGRQWQTTCEPYSATTRCRTEILATTIVQENGKFVQKSGWLFNNLTYLPSDRAIWKANPLGGMGEIGHEEPWMSDGRQWRTECDTAATGRGGCRSYIMATVIEVDPAGGYRSVNKWLFNNIVLFS